MPLLVTVVKAPESISVTEMSKTFSEQGGSLGRGKDNAWILDDPERFLSSCHCQISNENGQFYITDLSTNGTFFNGSVNPMGKGTKLALNDGNAFALGDYEFSVSVSMASQGADSDPFASNASAGQVPDNDIFSSPTTDDFGLNDASPFGGGHVSSSDSLFSTSAEETDPLAALDKAQGGSSSSLHDFAKTPSLSSTNDPFQSPPSDSFGQPTHSDQANPLNEQISWPNSVPEQGTGIPDDWDDDFLSGSPPPAAPAPTPTPPVVKPPPVMAKPAPVSASAKPPQVTAQSNAENTENVRAIVALRKEKEKIESELKILKQQVSAQKRSAQASSTHVDMALIEGMGLQDKNLVDEEINQLNKVVGEVVREMVSGLMQVLGSRSSIKNEFRMNVTTIQPVENNPLKFSANIDDALENMFIKQGNAYKKPVEAVREGFEGIAEHQVAILAGIRAAFRGVIERFDPLLLEQRFSKQKKSGIIPSSQKAKNWECYLEYYNDLAGDIDNSFQYLFGDEFVKAYEDQLQKLLITRKSRNKKSEQTE